MVTNEVLALAHRLATRVLVCPCLTASCVTCKLDIKVIRASGAMDELLRIDPSLSTDLGLTVDPVPEGAPHVG
jgi:hypothetical protein